jgi:hypothetical protein
MSEKLVGFGQTKNAVIVRKCQVWIHKAAYEYGYNYRDGRDVFRAPNGIGIRFASRGPGITFTSDNKIDIIQISKHGVTDLTTLVPPGTDLPLDDIEQAFKAFGELVATHDEHPPSDFGIPLGNRVLVAVNTGEKPHMVEETFIYLSHEVMQFLQRETWKSSTSLQLSVLVTNHQRYYANSKLYLPFADADRVVTLNNFTAVTFDVLSKTLTELAAAYRADRDANLAMLPCLKFV